MPWNEGGFWSRLAKLPMSDPDSRHFLRSALCPFFYSAKGLKQMAERRDFIESVLRNEESNRSVPSLAQ